MEACENPHLSGLGMAGAGSCSLTGGASEDPKDPELGVQNSVL